MTSPQTFGQRAAEVLKSAKRADPHLNWEKIAAILDAEFSAHSQLALEMEQPERQPLKKSERAALFEALVEACNLTTQEMTKPARTTTAVALAEILQATPLLSCDEISRRARCYLRTHPTWPLTPKALALHWHEFGTGGRTTQAKLDIYQEPPDWRDALRARGMPGWSADTIVEITSRAWEDIRATVGAEILARIR